MNLDQLEDLIRRYLSAGVAVVIILAAPVAGAATGAGTPDGAAEASATRPGAADEVEIRDGTPGATPEEDAERDGAAADGPPGPRPEEDAESDDTAEEQRAGEQDPSERDPSEQDPGEQDLGEEDAGEGTPAEEADRSEEDRGGEGDTDAGDDGTDQELRPGDGGDRGADEHGDAATGPGAEAGDPEAGDPETGDSETDDSAADDAGTDDDVPTEADLEARGPADDGGSGLVEDADEAEDAAEPARPNAGTIAGATAAERLGWGLPDQADDFRTADLEGWEVYTGPGYDGQGERSPDAVAVRDGVLTITGDAQGTTGGVCWGDGQRYGRWEARLRAPEADPAYHALMLLWPDADDFPTGGEIDVVELTDPTRRSAEFYLHFGEDNDQVRSEVQVDATQWHAWAVEWTPDGVTGYLDGEEWFSATDPDTLPPGPMHLCLQLDFFPTGDEGDGRVAEVRPSRMEVDWVRQYPLDEATATDGPPEDVQAPRDGTPEEDEPVSVGPAGLWERMFSW